MIEPAAYGAAVLFGPHVWNFRDAATRLLACGGACQVRDAAELEAVAGRLLTDASERGGTARLPRRSSAPSRGRPSALFALLDRLLAVGRGAERAA